MIGVSGSGKSTYIKNNLQGYVVCSADHFFMQDGKYVFEPAKLGEAHASSVRNFVNACTSNLTKIVVDNTNTSIEQIAPYYAVAKAFGYKVKFVKMNTDLDVCASRNLHGVGRKSIDGMSFNLSRLNLPKFWDFELIEVKGV